MKQILTLLIAITIFFYVLTPLNAKAAIKIDNESGINYSEMLTDEAGNTVQVEICNLNDEIHSTVHVNGNLTQKAIINLAKNEIQYTDYNEVSTYSGETETRFGTGVYRCSDFIQDVEVDESLDNTDISILSFDSSGWAYYGYYPATPSYFGSKPCTLYFYNYDENPYDNRYLVKNVSAGVGTPISIIAGLIGAFLTGGITLEAVLATFGTAIVADVITNAISGEICYSTQKIRYAPVIDGVNIFPDAYITKRYVITYDKLNGNMSYFLDREAYEFNRGETPDLIALNAQICELNNR